MQKHFRRTNSRRLFEFKESECTTSVQRVYNDCHWLVDAQLVWGGGRIVTMPQFSELSILLSTYKLTMLYSLF